MGRNRRSTLISARYSQDLPPMISFTLNNESNACSLQSFYPSIKLALSYGIHRISSRRPLLSFGTDPKYGRKEVFECLICFWCCRRLAKLPITWN